MTSKMAYDTIYKTGVSSLKLEIIISKNGYYSSEYAKDVLKDRFELGENAICKDCSYSYDYALCVLKGRFKLSEEMIYIYYPLDYCYEIMGYNHV